MSRHQRVVQQRRALAEESLRHEAWMIPYADLLTLLLALFVVLYAISSVNEGKFRVMSESLSEAFGGPPQSSRPADFGRRTGDTDDNTPAPVIPMRWDAPKPSEPAATATSDTGDAGEQNGDALGRQANALTQMNNELTLALGSLIERGLVHVVQTANTVEVELRTDLLFPSGSASMVRDAQEPLLAVAAVLFDYNNPLRIEGHTDNQPIRNQIYPSNWELSAARASSVVHLFARWGIAPSRMSVAGYGEFRPAASNDSDDGRNRNRRVVVIIGAPTGEGAGT